MKNDDINYAKKNNNQKEKMESISNMNNSSENYFATNPMNIVFNLQQGDDNVYDNQSFRPPPSFIGTVELPEEIIEKRNEENAEQNSLGIKGNNETISNNLFDLNDKLIFEDEDKYFFDELTKQNSKSSQKSIIKGNLLNKMPKAKNKKAKKYDTTEQIIQNIKTNFCNTYIIGEFNAKLKEEKSPLKFRKLPKAFVKDVEKTKNKQLMEKLLISLFDCEDYYGNKKPKSYWHNLKIIETLKEKNHEIYNILTTIKYREYYQKYLLSDTYKKNIDAIKNRHKNEIKYHDKFIKLSKHYVEHFTSKKNKKSIIFLTFYN